LPFHNSPFELDADLLIVIIGNDAKNNINTFGTIANHG